MGHTDICFLENNLLRKKRGAITRFALYFEFFKWPYGIHTVSEFFNTNMKLYNYKYTYAYFIGISFYCHFYAGK